ncbi:MAG TPA: glycosyltransferase family 9 protein [Vicinamibacterales bacterium]|nr:glycosyltransferase family 9 protein [Vicinamibacterales bacterium]
MKRLLIVRLGSLGDVVHAIPVAAALRTAFPQLRIDWLVSAKHREILDLVPVIDRRLVINDVVHAIRDLRAARYDVVLDLQGLIKSALLARLSGAPRVIGFSRRYAREGIARLFYTEAFDPGRGGIYDPRETRHVVDINLALLETLGITAARPEFPIETVQSEAAATVARDAGGSYVLINPGAAWPNKRWPPERFAAIARALRDRVGLRSVVIWGPGERSLADAVVAAAQGAALASPETTVADLVAISRGAAVMISGDTGPTHIASAVGTPIVGLFGPTRPSRNGPLSPLDVSVSRDSICQCHHLRRCTRDRMCLLDIEVEEVLSAVERRLAVEPSRV